MQTTARVFVFTAAVLALSAGALAPAGAPQPMQKMRPGLWEHSGTLKSQSGQIEAAMAQAQKSMAAMPPAQRKPMEQMMAAQGVDVGMGSGSGSGANKGHTVKVCITPEQAAMDEVPQQDGCTQKVQRVDASTMKMTFQCKGDTDTPPASGEGTVQLQGPAAYTGQFKIKTAGANGKPEQIDMAQSGKWLSDNCGAIKPARMGR